METWETEWNRDVLMRIVALLFSLADLSDRAAGVSILRRRRVLGIVSHGEAVARAFLIGVPAEAVGGDAKRLGARLRALALLLIGMLTRRMAGTTEAVARGVRCRSAGFAGRTVAAAAFDTS